ncbi:GNAT family N-acetyltransferase [uncultured Lacinutrix sp.]|uniref:GNAT family N-acetyltransferase n=1 Tax=uncultured Lacinutrix sp. TaxID=574032 RepID=UPI00262B6C05|nr:GNAT family N-acetyltransferase [uncultured Lacinutrix sp.]
MLNIIKTDSENPDFIALVKALDSYLKITDGDEHDFYNQFNNIDVLKHVAIAYKDNIPVACGAFKAFNNNNTAEIKRMFTVHNYRGQGIARNILKTLELWAKESGFSALVLETGIRQVEAVSFYKNCEYSIIPNYGQYKDMENSLCFKKILD